MMAALEKYFGDVKEKSITNNNRSTIKKTIIKKGNAGSKKSWFLPFIAKYCPGMEKIITPAKQSYECECGNVYRVVYANQVKWASLFRHALSHLWENLYGQVYPSALPYREAMEKHPQETGATFMKCFGGERKK